MNRDQRLLMVLHREATAWESLAAALDLVYSPAARKTYRDYAGATTLLRKSLSDDDTVIVRITRPKKLGPWIMLGLLAIVIVFEYGSYTVPALLEWLQTVAHRCGF